MQRSSPLGSQGSCTHVQVQGDGGHVHNAMFSLPCPAQQQRGAARVTRHRLQRADEPTLLAAVTGNPALNKQAVYRAHVYGIWLLSH